MKSISTILLISLSIILQGCGDEVSFSLKPQALSSNADILDLEENGFEEELENEPPVLVCNPLDSSTHSLCPDPSSKSGLVGKLYYLTEDLADSIGKTLLSAKIDDYINVGVKTNTLIQFNQVNVTPRPWDAGFKAADGKLVKRDDGSDLFEWFAVHLNGKIKIPKGQWQLAIESDDGMRVTLDGKIILNDDGVHAPRTTCAGMTVVSDGNTELPIDIKYFQGPRYQIAMNLVYRKASRADTVSCANETEWKTFEAKAFSH